MNSEKSPVVEVLLLFCFLAVLVAALTDHLTGEVAILISAGFAICGWMIQSQIALKNSVMQHTMNVLLQSRFSPVLKGYIDELRRHFDDGPISEVDLNDPQKKDGIRAALYLANFYEFLAIGMRRGDLLRELLYDSIRGQVVNLYDRIEPALRQQRENDRIKPSKRYTELMKLVEDWRLPGDPKRKQ